MVPVARYAAAGLGGLTAIVLAANPTTRWFAQLRRQGDPDYPDDVPLLFDVNTEATVPTWYSAALLLAVAAVCGVLVVVSTVAGRGGGGRWAILALVFAGMSMDEVAALHERLGSGVTDRLGVDATGALRHPWVVAGVVLAAALGAVTAWAIASLPRRPRRWAAFGLGMYIAGALGLEAASGAVLDARGNGLAYAAVTWAEEAAEMVGALIVCCALLAALDVRVHGGALRVGLAGTAGAAQVPTVIPRPASAARPLVTDQATASAVASRRGLGPPARSNPGSVPDRTPSTRSARPTRSARW
jgi:hypothetical protein